MGISQQRCCCTAFSPAATRTCSGPCSPSAAVLFLLPYVGMVLAFLRLRRKDPTHPRPFRVPGGPLAAHGAAWLCIGILSIAIVLFMYTPGSGAEWAVIAGVIAQLALGEVLIRWGEQHGEALAADI
jgi:amino acid transporter